MRQELDEKLCAKYPEIFANRHASMKDSAMCWGFECGDGWYNILDTLCFSIQNRIKHQKIPQVVAIQVKEKFGGLRFYYSGGDETVWGMAYMAEALSECTCEVCGSPGEQTHGGWIKTLCKKCKVDS